MRKLLLLSAALLGMSWASAETVTWVAADQGYENAEAVETIVVNDAVTITLDAGSNNNAPKYYDGGSALRVYAGNTITFACTQELTQIVFNCVSSSYVASETTEVTAGDYTIEDATLTWTGSASDLVITTGSGNQFRIVSMEITYGGEPAERPNYTAEGIVTNPSGDWADWNPNYLPEVFVNVESYDGYVIVRDWSGVEGYDLKVEFDDETNVTKVTCYENGEEVSSGTNGYMNAYTGYAHEDFYCLQIYIGVNYTYAYTNNSSQYGYVALSAYFYREIPSEDESEENDVEYFWGTYWVEWPYVAPVESVSSLNALTDFADGAEFEMGIDLTVVYANGSYNYVTDGTTYALIYKYGLGLEAGDVIAAGWQGEMSIYNNLPELVPTTDIETNGTATVPDPTHVETADVAMNVAANNLCNYLCLEGIVFEDATPASGSFTGLAGDDEITFYNTFKLESVEAGTYNVTGFVSIYKETVQFIPVEYAEASTVGISSIEADGNGEAQYFNLQGIRVANPEAGKVYIRIADGKASKIVK
ncbi:MAG: hypothetical protein LIP03_01255 [Bacteroidales bacterium]|nr:hypothetical protein [Bacteroidales bacterium]